MPQTQQAGRALPCRITPSKDRFIYKDVLEFRGAKGEALLAFIVSEHQRDTRVLRVEFELRGQQQVHTGTFLNWIKESLVELVEGQGIEIDEYFSIGGVG